MRKPRITIGKADHARLTQLANGLYDRNPERAEELMAELDRARVVEQSRVPADAVRIGTTLDYRTDDGEPRRITLVLPAEADISSNRVSVLTPIGTALIGLSAGQSIDFTANDGRGHRLTVEAVQQPADAVA